MNFTKYVKDELPLIFWNIIKDSHVVRQLGLTLKNSLCCVTFSVCMCVWLRAGAPQSTNDSWW